MLSNGFAVLIWTLDLLPADGQVLLSFPAQTGKPAHFLVYLDLDRPLIKATETLTKLDIYTLSNCRMDPVERLYENLSLGESQIRLLKLFPGRPGSGLIGALAVYAFPYRRDVEHERPPYEALSYFWGPKSPQGTECVIQILVRGSLYSISIRPNLDKALRRLRYDDKHRWLWIDALCIFQKKHSDCATKEKNLQLPIMHEIYNRAERVCVWLGEDDDRSTNAMRFVKSINTLDYFDKFMKDDSQEAESLADFAQLLRRPWFNRRWIVQEIATARAAKIYCGTEELPWKDFAKAVSVFASRIADIKRKFRASRKFGHSKCWYSPFPYPKSNCPFKLLAVGHIC